MLVGLINFYLTIVERKGKEKFESKIWWQKFFQIILNNTFYSSTFNSNILQEKWSKRTNIYIPMSILSCTKTSLLVIVT